jgi:cytochrome c oxidase subunit III
MRSALSEHVEKDQFPQYPAPVAIHPAGDGHTPHHPYLQHHFDSMAQQAEASTLGMWTFLVTEIMFFGGLFTAYLVYRHQSPQGFQEASHHLNIYWGAANTAILIISSLTMAFAVRAAQTSQKRETQVFWLLSTMFFGAAFLGIKAKEYYDKFADHIIPGPHFQWEGLYPKPAEQFYSLYFAMTGLHALHMIIGLGIMTVITVMAWKKQFDHEYYTPVEVAGLYWHFVDIVWIFLFPLLYLIGRHYHAG